MKNATRAKSLLLMSGLLISSMASVHGAIGGGLIDIAEGLGKIKENIEKLETLKLSDMPGIFEGFGFPETISILQTIELDLPKFSEGPKGEVGDEKIFDDSLMITAAGRVQGITVAEIKLVIAVIDGVTRFSVGFEVPDEYSLSDIIPAAKGFLGEFTFPSAAIEVSEFDYEMGDLQVERGANIRGMWNLESGPLLLIKAFKNTLSNALKSIQAKGLGTVVDSYVLEGDTAEVWGIIRLDLPKSRLKMKLPLRWGIDFTKLMQARVLEYIKVGDIEVEIDPELSATVSAGLFLGLPTQEEPIELRAGFQIGATIAGLHAEMEGLWDPAFGIPWLALGEFGIEIDWDYATMAVLAEAGIPLSGLGMRGKLELGPRDDGERMSLDLAGALTITIGEAATSDVGEFVFQFSQENLRLSDFVMFIVERAKKVGILPKAFRPKIPRVNFKKFNGYVAPRAAEVGGKEYDAGISGEAQIQLGQLDGYLGFSVDPENLLVSAEGRLAKIEIPNIFRLTGAGPDGQYGTADDGPFVKFKFVADRPNEIEFTADSQVEIMPLGIKQTAKLNLELDEIKGTFEAKIFDLFNVDIDFRASLLDPEDFFVKFDLRQDYADFIRDKVLNGLKGKFNKIKQDTSAALNKLDDEIEKAQADFDNLASAEIDRVNGEIARLNREIADLEEECDRLLAIFTNPEECINLGLKKAEKAALVFYKETILKPGAVLTGAVLEVAETLSESKLAKLIKNKVLDVAQIVVGALSKAATTVTVERIAGEVRGKDLLAGKLPRLKTFQLQFNFDETILGQRIKIQKTVSLDNIQFDFNNPEESIKPVLDNIVKTIVEPIENILGVKLFEAK